MWLKPPRPSPRPNLERLPRRKLMTIAAGFVCSDGLVLFADTEEQMGLMKTKVEKIREYESGDIRMAVAGAGNGSLADSLVDRLFESVEGKTPHKATILGVLRQVILDFHREEVAFYPSSDDVKQVGLIIGLQIKAEKPLLLHSDATALRLVTQFAVIGIGAEIKFLAQQLYYEGMPVKHGVLIANHLCKTAKDHVQGCGGDSRIAILANGKIEIRHFFDVWEEEKVFMSLSANYRAILLSIPDKNITDEQFNNCVERFVAEAWGQREQSLEFKELNEELKQKMKEHQPWNFEGHYYSPLEMEKTYGFGFSRRAKFQLEQAKKARELEEAQNKQ